MASEVFVGGQNRRDSLFNRQNKCGAVLDTLPIPSLPLHMAIDNRWEKKGCKSSFSEQYPRGIGGGRVYVTHAGWRNMVVSMREFWAISHSRGVGDYHNHPLSIPLLPTTIHANGIVTDSYIDKQYTTVWQSQSNVATYIMISLGALHTKYHT